MSAAVTRTILGGSTLATVATPTSSSWGTGRVVTVQCVVMWWTTVVLTKFDRTDYAVPPRQPMRSRTPGPEFMRRSPDRDDPYFQQGGATDMRSKTPTPSSGDAHYRHHNISGTPDFIPASRYQAPPSAPSNRHNNGAPPLTNHHGNARPLSNPDLVHTYGKDAYGLSMHQTRLPSSQSHTGALSGMAPGGAMHHSPYGNNFIPGRPMSPPVSNLVRKQSTSFEHEEPTPMNLTRVQGHGDPWGVGDSGSDGLNHSRSPALSFDCDDCSIDLTVALRRQESGFGFRIVVGGTGGGDHRWVGGHVNNSGKLRGCLKTLKVLSVGVITIFVASDGYVMIVHL